MREKPIEEKPDLIKSWRLWAGIIFLLLFLVVITGQGELFQGALKAKPDLTLTKQVVIPAGQTTMKAAVGDKNHHPDKTTDCDNRATGENADSTEHNRTV